MEGSLIKAVAWDTHAHVGLDTYSVQTHPQTHTGEM